MAGAEMDRSALDDLIKEGPIDTGGALRAIGALLIEESTNAFRQQGVRGGDKWAERITPNWPAIMRALQQGATTFRARWFRSRPALVDTGRLRGSFDVRIDEKQGVVSLVTNVPYAMDHHEGREVTIPGAKNEPIRSGLLNLLRQRPDQSKNLAWLLHRDSVKIKLRKRPLAEFTPAILRDINEIVARFAKFSEDKK